ncbi:MAG: TonB-dependent receptor domain-containing protein, partial [Chitinophagaceae bacterium]
MQWILVLLILLPTFLFSQLTVSNISGSVKDENGKPVIGAEVVATNIPTGSRYKTISGKNGLYYIANVNPGGPYRINTIINGKNVVVEIPSINVGEEGVAILSSPIDASVAKDSIQKIHITNLSEVIVSNKNTGINKSGPSQAFDNQQIKSLPTIRRSIQDFTTLNSYVGNGFSFAGRDGRYNNFTVDGASLNNSFGLSTGLPGGDAQPISLDAIDQISIMISPFDIRQSNFTGGAVNLVTKGGTNTVHGSAYGFFRNQSFNGTTVNGEKVQTTNASFATYGLTLGGPILKNKLFYFLSYENEIRQFPGASWVPDNGSNAGEGNVSKVTTAELDQLSKFVADNYGYSTGGYNMNQFGAINYKILGRIDWNINEKNKLMVRYNYVYGTNDQIVNATSIPGNLTRGTFGRVGQNAYSFANSNYIFTNNVQSFVLDLKSTINNQLSNQLLITYALDKSTRGSNSKPFPFVDLWNSGNNYMSFGYELYSPDNDATNHTLSINNNLTVLLGSHTLLAGVGFDYLHFRNSFMPAGYSYYKFASPDDFYTRKNPIAFAITYPYEGQDPASKLDFGQLYAYIQDEYKITEYFKLMASVRMDIPLYLNTLTKNDAIANIDYFRLPNGNPVNLDVSRWPNVSPLFSPRISFTYDILEDKSLILRGGGGLFTGRIPFVWLVAQPQSSGVLNTTYTVQNNNGLNMTFSPDPSYYLKNPVSDQESNLINLPTQPATDFIPSQIISFDPKFKMPQVLRVYLAADYTFAKDFTATIEALYTKDINQVLIYNVGYNPLTYDGNFYDGRNAYWNNFNTDPYAPNDKNSGFINSVGFTQPYINGQVNSPMYVTNTNKGQGVSLTLALNKKFSKNWIAGVSYTFTEYLDLTSNPGSQVTSAWSNTPSKNGPNFFDLANSDYAMPHKISGFISYSIDYAKYFGTSIA